MSIQRYSDSFGEGMPSSFSSMLDRFFSDSLASRGRLERFSPHADAYETDSSYEIEVALPGMKREDVHVEVQQGRLTIQGERRFQNEKNERRYHVVESSYGSFYRAFQLPETIDPKQIRASFEDGVLRISVPKNEERTMKHRIEIGAGGVGSATEPQGAGRQGADQLAGRMSQQLNREATEVPVEGGSTNGNGRAGNGSASGNGNGASSNGTSSGSAHNSGSGSGQASGNGSASRAGAASGAAGGAAAGGSGGAKRSSK